MKLTLQVQLLPDAAQAASLKATMERFNEAAGWLAGHAFASGSANKFALQKAHYRELRERFNLSAQMAVRCIAQVCECFKRDKSKRPRFRKHAAIPYDQRILSFKGIDRVSILTLDGRVVVPFVMGKYQHERFGFARGQCDLVLRRDGKWFLLVTADVPDKAPVPTTDFIGVDLGVVRLATTSDGETFAGAAVEAVRQKRTAERRSLGRKMSHRNKRRTRKNARRAMKRIGGKEARFRRDVNHCIAKKIVVKAIGSGRGVALEDLRGIRDRTRFRKRQRNKMGGWAFFQLRSFISYKGRMHGVSIVAVDPRNTSRTCNECGHCEKANRPSQAIFKCRQCGHTANADINAAANIAARARVNAPQVSQPQPIAAA
nr:transposase [uncultured Rhodopila sp.]